MIGRIFRVGFYGESHGKGIGTVIEGCPPGIAINEGDIAEELSKRRVRDPRISTQRVEEDRFEVLSGIFNGYTSGAPINIFIYNRDVDSRHYEEFRVKPRPSHADYTAYVKYHGYNDYRGGGIFSGRLTAAMIVAGTVAKKLLERYGIEVLAHTYSVGSLVVGKDVDINMIKENVYKNPVRCADPKAAEEVYRLIEMVRREGDSIGGIVECIALNLPVGLGEPPIDSLDGDISKAIFVIPGVKGVEFGLGFQITRLLGSEANDPFTIENGRVVTEKNNSGGINGGISNGMPLKFRVAFKPTPSIYKTQKTVDLKKMEETSLRIKGRFDPCIAIRAVPVVESITAIVLADHLLRWLAWEGYIGGGDG